MPIESDLLEQGVLFAIYDMQQRSHHAFCEPAWINTNDWHQSWKESRAPVIIPLSQAIRQLKESGHVAQTKQL